jgi:predicted acetyltransferase
MTTASDSLPVPEEPLSSGEITLRFVAVGSGDAPRGLVPFYHFRILSEEGEDVGQINFRVGDTDHVRLCAGHIGFEVLEPFRGRGYARQACEAMAPWVRRFYEAVTITCDPDNLPSRRTIEHLGAAFLDEVAVPAHDPHHQRGSRWKRRYLWTVGPRRRPSK